MRYDAALSMLGRCRIGVVLLQPERGNDFTGQPNKLFEFMGAGLAIIVSDFPEIGRVVREHDCGILVDPRDPHAIASALNAALAQPGRCRAQGLAGARAVAERYNWARAEAVLLDAYSGLMR
jgi:glycosyltransferase involved in cell wall biosynthesis